MSEVRGARSVNISGLVDAALEISEQEEEAARRIMELLRQGRDKEALPLVKEFFRDYFGETEDEDR